jgi:hypothetical protein
MTARGANRGPCRGPDGRAERGRIDGALRRRLLWRQANLSLSILPAHHIVGLKLVKRLTASG